MLADTSFIEALEGRQLMAASPHASFYLQTNLVSDTAATPASHHDANLVNPWGLAAQAKRPWLVANNRTGARPAYTAHRTSTAHTAMIPRPDTDARHANSTALSAH